MPFGPVRACGPIPPCAARFARALVPPSHEDEGVYAARRAQGNLPYDSPGTFLPLFVPGEFSGSCLVHGEGGGHPPGWLRSASLHSVPPPVSCAPSGLVSGGPLPLRRPRVATPPERVSPSFTNVCGQSLAQVLGLGGAGSPIRWSKLHFIVGACAAGMHRRPKCVASSGIILEPAPVRLGAGTT